jgi:hypothetical protein
LDCWPGDGELLQQQMSIHKDDVISKKETIAQRQEEEMTDGNGRMGKE